MRMFLVLCWLTIPFCAWAYHVGPGQQKMKLDDTSELLTQASLAEKRQEFSNARTLYAQSLATLPADRKADSYAIRLAHAKTQLETKQLPEARVALQGLMDELEAAPAVDSKLEDDVRNTLANAQYHMTWLMRLEGKTLESWEPEIEAARQNYRLLTEKAQKAGDEHQATDRKHDLEAAIRLARLDLSELQALKIPSKCQGCCSGQCNKPGNKQKPKTGQNKNPASPGGLGPIPDGSGS